MERITLGGGCFWCLDAAYRRVRGVNDVVSGYAGGHQTDPTYQQVCSGTTGHAEVVRLGFDSGVIDLEQLLDIFWMIHDPTTLNRQGADVGTQYRSIILYEHEEQLPVIESSFTAAKKMWGGPVTTECRALTQFFPAEEVHQDYFNKNPGNGYCYVVINPKLAKLRKKYAALLVE